VDIVFEFNQWIIIHCYIKHVWIKTTKSVKIPIDLTQESVKQTKDKYGFENGARGLGKLII